MVLGGLQDLGVRVEGLMLEEFRARDLDLGF